MMFSKQLAMVPTVLRVKLDGVVTVVDSKHVTRHLDAPRDGDAVSEAVDQIAYADRILLNKTDLVREDTRRTGWKGKERKGKERKGKERKGKERKGKEREEWKPHVLLDQPCMWLCVWCVRVNVEKNGYSSRCGCRSSRSGSWGYRWR
jgi:hypothetical protein